MFTQCVTCRDSPCSMSRKARPSLRPALGHGMPPFLQVASHVFVLLAEIIHFNRGFMWLQTFNALKVRGLGRPGKHSGHIYWVMYAITSRAVWGVQLLSNKMKRGVLWWPRASQYSNKWLAMIFAWYFVEFDVPLICTSNVLPYQKCHPKNLSPHPQAPRCASSNSAWLPMRRHTCCLPSPRCRMKQCLFIIFDTVHFDTCNSATVSFTGFAFNVTLILTVCDCHGIVLVSFWLSGWHLHWILMDEIDWLNTIKID